MVKVKNYVVLVVILITVLLGCRLRKVDPPPLASTDPGSPQQFSLLAISGPSGCFVNVPLTGSAKVTLEVKYYDITDHVMMGFPKCVYECKYSSRC